MTNFCKQRGTVTCWVWLPFLLAGLSCSADLDVGHVASRPEIPEVAVAYPGFTDESMYFDFMAGAQQLFDGSTVVFATVCKGGSSPACDPGFFRMDDSFRWLDGHDGTVIDSRSEANVYARAFLFGPDGNFVTVSWENNLLGSPNGNDTYWNVVSNSELIPGLPSQGNTWNLSTFPTIPALPATHAEAHTAFYDPRGLLVILGEVLPQGETSPRVASAVRWDKNNDEDENFNLEINKAPRDVFLTGALSIADGGYIVAGWDRGFQRQRSLWVHRYRDDGVLQMDLTPLLSTTINPDCSIWPTSMTLSGDGTLHLIINEACGRSDIAPTTVFHVRIRADLHIDKEALFEESFVPERGLPEARIVADNSGVWVAKWLNKTPTGQMLQTLNLWHEDRRGDYRSKTVEILQYIRTISIDSMTVLPSGDLIVAGAGYTNGNPKGSFVVRVRH